MGTSAQRATALFAVVFAAVACAVGCDAGNTTPTPPTAPPAASATSPDVGPTSPLVLPLEILGAPGTEVVLRFDLGAVRPVRVALTIHNVVEAGAFELVVNGRPPIDLGNATSPFVSARGDVRKGSIELPADVLASGANRLAFRYVRQVPNVSGFRILAIAIDDDTPIVQTAASPAVTLSAEAAAIARGETFFRDVSRDGGPVCAQCHTDRGEDVKYFAFSSHSIVERAMFHLFTRAEAEDIASYIASLDVPSPGHVYAPPFQPGAGATGSAGAGFAAALATDDAFAALPALAGTPKLTADVAWTWAENVDTHDLPAPIQFPSWFRWLPRHFEPAWLTANDSALAKAASDLARDASLAHAQAFGSVAVALGKELMIRGDDAGRIELMRYAAVKLWDWSRKLGFDEPHHGFPDGAPAYPYEVGFAMFEAKKNNRGIAEGPQQILQWWWLQLSVHAGRGQSNGLRPLNYLDVETAAVDAGAGLAAQAFLHLLGSWEESRGALAPVFGTAQGPVRLLDPMMRSMPAPQRATILRRFLDRETAHVSAGGTFDQGHRQLLATAWNRGCKGLGPDVVAALRASAPSALSADLAGCP